MVAQFQFPPLREQNWTEFPSLGLNSAWYQPLQLFVQWTSRWEFSSSCSLSLFVSQISKSRKIVFLYILIKVEQYSMCYIQFFYVLMLKSYLLWCLKFTFDCIFLYFSEYLPLFFFTYIFHYLPYYTWDPEWHLHPTFILYQVFEIHKIFQS